MALVLADRVQETTTTTGTGTVTLAGAVAGFQSFAVIGDGNTTYYCITSGNNWEVGVGTYTSAGTTLARTTILASSASGAAITLAGTSNVFCVYPAGKAFGLDQVLGLANGGTGNTTAPAAQAALMGFTTTATAGGTTALTNTSSVYQIFTGSSAQTITLPSTATLAQGWFFHICNNSTGTLTLQTSTAVSLGTIPPGLTVMASCVDTTVNTAAAWEYGYTDFSTITGTGASVLADSPTITDLMLSAGTATLPPLQFTAGTNLTAAAAGAVEYDGVVFYGTGNTTSGRGYVPSSQIFRLTANGSAITTIANFFGANSAINLAAGGVYEIEAHCYFLKTTAGTATVTITSSLAPANLSGVIQTGAVGGGTAVGAANQIAIFNSTATAAAFGATGSLTTAVNHYMKISLIVEANASASNLRINFTSSAGSITPLRTSYYKVTRLPAGNTGSFAA